MDHLTLPALDLIPSSRRSSRSSHGSVVSSRSSKSSLTNHRIFKVLILSSSLDQANEVHKVISTGNYDQFEFRYPSTLNYSLLDMESLYKDCSDVIREEEIDVIISVHPGLEFLHAALLKDFPNLRGPSFESVFIALHRHYAREIACEGFAIFSKTVNINEYNSVKMQSILDDTTTPALIKEAYSFDDAFSKKIRSGKVIENEMEAIKNLLDDRKQLLEGLILENLDVARYDTCLDLCCTIEEYIKPGKRTGSLHLIEACVVDGIVVPWCISDIGLYKQRPVVVKHVSCPSQLDESMKYNLWGVYREVAQRLIALGFDNQFLQMEIFVGRNEVLRVLNVTPSLNRANITLYRHVMMNGDSLSAQVDAGLGRVPRNPRVIPQRCAMRASISSQVYNVTLDQVFDLKQAKMLEGLTLVKSKPDYLIEQENADEDGVHIADVSISDSNYRNCYQALKTLCTKAVKDWASLKSSRSEI